MAKIVDTSRSRCITCGNPYKVGESLYSLASKFEWEGDTKFLTEFEHAGCHVPFEEAMADLKNRLAELKEKTKF